MMIGMDVIRDRSRVFEIDGVKIHADRPGPERFVRHFCRDPADERGIESSGKQESYRRVRIQSFAHTLDQQVVDMRLQEGAHLREDLAYHLGEAEKLRLAIAEKAPQIPAQYRQKLLSRLESLQVENIDPARIAQEVALIADKCAIDEELSRLSSHFHQMHVYLDAQGEIGKKMDFLIQEMNREANTIGSKAMDAEIAQYVVNLKSEIEKMREQVQNVE